MQRYPIARYFNSIAEYNNIHKDNIPTILHYYTTISTVTMFQQYFTVQQSPPGQYFKKQAHRQHQEQQSTDLAFGKIQVPRRNRFSCTYVHTQISMHCNGQVEAFKKIFIPWALPALNDIFLV